MNERQQIRQEIKAKRAALTAEQRKSANHLIAEEIIAAAIFKKSQKIACYMAKEAEVDLSAVIEVIFSLGKHCYLPLVRQDKSGYLHFVEYCANDKLQTGSFGILEPVFDPQKIIKPDDLDLVLLPVVVFDSKGNRLGTGGGYYDRTFAQTSQPVLIGTAYACQEVPQIKPQSWDVKLHGVVTEETFNIID
jgi:5-formyltetrahydrofolate cyclo-ligase